ncbi:MAG: hypothetical protein WA231_16520 [Methylocella sp.]
MARGNFFNEMFLQAHAESFDKGKIVQRCLNMLPVPHCEVIDLVYYHEKSIKEVGEISVSG